MVHSLQYTRKRGLFQLLGIALISALFFLLGSLNASASVDGFSSDVTESIFGVEGTDAFKESSDVMKSITTDVGLDAEVVEESKRAFSPIAKVANKLIGILSIVIVFAIIIMSLLDIIYLILPPVRPLLLNPNRSWQLVTNYPVLFVQQYEGQPQGGQQQQQGGMGGGMGMGGMGGMGQQQQPQANQPKIKGVIYPYLVYRTKEYIFAGVALAIFSGTMLTDIGLKIVSLIPGV